MARFAFKPLHLLNHNNDLINLVASKAIICCDDGFSYSAALVIGYLMKSYNWTCLDAYIYVRDRRYRINVSMSLLKQLTEWDKQRKFISQGDTKHYGCICGASVFTLRSPFSKPIRVCRCTVHFYQYNPFCVF